MDAVVDKDSSSSKLAGQLGADMLLILTAVDTVYINFGTPEQQKLGHISVEAARTYWPPDQWRQLLPAAGRREYRRIAGTPKPQT